jgi:hypothetical protein
MMSDYQRNHRRVYAAKGKASQQICVACGEQAAHWSHTHNTDPANVDNYQPRCFVCHFAYDGVPGKVSAANKAWHRRQKQNIADAIMREFPMKRDV